MSSEGSVGVCLSTEKSYSTFSLTSESGQAPTEPSLSVKSLSLTNISATDNSDVRKFSNIPTLLSLPPEERQVGLKYGGERPRLLSATGDAPLGSTTSGVTSTLEGTLDDIPDFQDTPSRVAVKEVTRVTEAIELPPIPPDASPEVNTSTRGSKPSIPVHPGLPAKPEIDTQFMTDVKRSVKLRRPSSAKSVASGPKTSTSGITVVEIKQSTSSPKRPSSELDEKSEGLHEVGMASSSENTTSKNISETSAFREFKPKKIRRPEPFLLQMPSDEELDKRHEGRQVLTEKKAITDRNKPSPAKSWRSIENESRTSKDQDSVYKVVYVDKHNRKHSKRSSSTRLDANGIKAIVKEEMNAIVNMQNDIWHKILDSFVEKHRGESLGPPRQQITGKQELSFHRSNKIPLLTMPDENSETFYKPMDIPIIKPPQKPQVMLKLPPESMDDKLEDGLQERMMPSSPLKERHSLESNYKRSKLPIFQKHHPVDDASVNENSVKGNNVVIPENISKKIDQEVLTVAPEVVNAAVQTAVSPVERKPSLPPSGDLKSFAHEVQVSLEHNKRPVSMNPDYQALVNASQIPLRAIEECRLLLESIQHSADELKELKNNTTDPQNNQVPLVPVIEKLEKKASNQTFHKNRHELFLDNFFGEEKASIAKRKFLDVVNITKTSSDGHFGITGFTPSPAKLVHLDTKVGPRVIATKSVTDHEPLKNSLNFDKSSPSQYPKQVSISSQLLRDESASLDKECTDDSGPNDGTLHDVNEVEDDDLRKELVDTSTKNEATELSSSLSTIQNYLSHSNESSSDRTITENDTSPLAQKDFSSKGGGGRPDATGALLKRKEDQIPKPPPPTTSDPALYGSFIQDNITNIRETRYGARSQEIERFKRVQSILSSRKTTALPEFADSSSVKSQSRIMPSEPLEIPMSIQSPPALHHPDSFKIDLPNRGIPVIEDDDVISSGTTSLPTNTDDLIDAALNGGSVISLDVAATPLKSEIKTPQVKANSDLQEWMEKKRRERMAIFQNERKAKIDQERTPFKPSKTTSIRKPQNFDRTAAIIRRLHTAEVLLDDIKHTPAKVKLSKTPCRIAKDKTMEWVHSIDINEMDSVHSPSLNSEGGGASQITPDISIS